MKVNILRQQSPDSEPYWETFHYDGPKRISVAGLLDYLNYHDDIEDENGRKTTRIHWDCSCLQGVCGACAMVINDMPALACETFIDTETENELTLRPLRKFPVQRDLIVDRSVIWDNLTSLNISIGEYQPASQKEQAHSYQAAKCLKCGLCLEVCPNYTNGKTFFGAVFANDCYLVTARNTTKSKEMRTVYNEHFGGNCSKALSCMTVCPAGIPTITSMAKLNRRNGIK